MLVRDFKLIDKNITKNTEKDDVFKENQYLVKIFQKNDDVKTFPKKDDSITFEISSLLEPKELLFRQK